MVLLNSALSMLVLVSTVAVQPSPAQTYDFPYGGIDVLTYHNDNMRTGQYLQEHQLTPANVNASSFGKLFAVLVDGKVDAQPLYVSTLQLPGIGARDVVFAATEHDSVYAFDAASGAIYWQVSLLKSGETPSDPLHCTQVIPEIGITATPVIDRAVGPHGTIYVVAMSKNAAGAYNQRLHALDLATGVEEFGGPVDIQASYPGTGAQSSNGSVLFDPKQHEDRAALLLVNGVVYTSWTSHCDIQPYTGFVIGYDEWSLGQRSVFDFAPNGSEASIWNSGAGPAADSRGNLYFSVANGTFDTTLNGQGFPINGDYGNAFVALTPVRNRLATEALRVSDYWTMYNTVSESSQDEDLGSGGILLLPNILDSTGRVRALAVGAGKDRNIYVVDRDNMGKFNSTGNNTLYQEIPNALSGAEFAQPAWFNGTVYMGAVGDSIRAYKLVAGRLPMTPSSMTQASFPYPGTNPVISANGTRDAILWAYDNGASATVPAVLHAYDPNDLAVEFYNSNQAVGGRDQFGPGNKFITPTVANGRVYVGTGNSVVAFGLLQR